MCSIAGIVGRVGVEKMIDIQKHRAPDESGVFRSDKIEMGMGRLKILDLISDGITPFEDEDYVLVYNGEIYNYIELREELRSKGHVFRTTGDVEVLFRAWKEWGEDVFRRLNGMHAFAIYDRKEGKLHLARDIAGEKPLYLYRKGETFAFASEAKAFHGVLPLSPREDTFFSAFQHVSRETLWQEVESLPPAHRAVFDIGTGKLDVTPHWEFQLRDITASTALEELESILEDAVRIRTCSDVPYGLYLSDGVDSSIISTLFPFENTFFSMMQMTGKMTFFQRLKILHGIWIFLWDLFLLIRSGNWPNRRNKM